MRKLLTPNPIEGRENWGIPPEPETECDPILQEKIVHFHSLSKKGVHFNENLLKNKAFRNPHIYNKLVEFVELDEIGSNFDREIFDPYGFPSEAFADQLGKFMNMNIIFSSIRIFDNRPEYDIILSLFQSGSSKENFGGTCRSAATTTVTNTICRA
ncbi:HCNGP-like protein [Gigaspora rosea]|uniref:HCNGP-like protein n=1 Tax=Gigaspora rosea TaxID=44941 RepID=A0A397V8B5_9GLOM|nr:HCNGP-like protein [Gigaspora rosea]